MALGGAWEEPGPRYTPTNGAAGTLRRLPRLGDCEEPEARASPGRPIRPLPDPAEEDAGEPEDPWHKVPGGASRQAFVATLEAWGSCATDGRKGFLFSKDDLFLDAQGDFDPSLQADFWREAAIYDDWKSESAEIAKAKAADFRENAAGQRQGDCRNQEGPKVDPANCFHDYQERPDPDRPGWLKTSCPHCGKVLGSRPEKSK